jgi:hypothetical protein
MGKCGLVFAAAAVYDKFTAVTGTVVDVYRSRLGSSKQIGHVCVIGFLIRKGADTQRALYGHGIKMKELVIGGEAEFQFLDQGFGVGLVLAGVDQIMVSLGHEFFGDSIVIILGRQYLSQAA